MDNSHAPGNSPRVLCPFCPVCGTPPPFIFDWLDQAFCPNEDCEVFAWCPFETAAKNLSDTSEIDLSMLDPRENP